MGIYIFDTRRAGARAAARRRGRLDPRLRPRHHPAPGGRGRAGLRLPVLGREQEGVAVLARRRDARRLLRGVDGPRPGRPRLQPLRPGLAAAHLPAAAAAGQVRVRRGGPARRRHASRSSPWAASSRAARCAARSCARTCASTRTARSRTRSCCRARPCTATRASAARSSTAASSCRAGARRRLRPGRGPPAPHRLRGRRRGRHARRGVLRRSRGAPSRVS